MNKLPDADTNIGSVLVFQNTYIFKNKIKWNKNQYLRLLLPTRRQGVTNKYVSGINTFSLILERKLHSANTSNKETQHQLLKS